MSSRKDVPLDTQAKVLELSKRRCCLCCGLDNDYGEKHGQIAHLDHNPSNNDLDNLAWMCLSHHDKYDTKHRQSKSYTEIEAKKYRQKLYDELPSIMNNQQPPLIIKDSKFNTDAKNAKEAIGMEVKTPAMLTNVEVNLTVGGNVERAIGFSSDQGIASILAKCKNCGKQFSAVVTGQLPSKLICPYCGTEN